MKVNIAGLDKSEVLLALYNNAAFKGPEFSSSPSLSKMIANLPPATLEEAKKEFEECSKTGSYFFDSIRLGYGANRPLRVDLSGSEFDSTEYDNFHGAGLAENIITELRNSKIEVKPQIDNNGNLIIARINENQKFKTDHVGICIVTGNVGMGAEVDCRKSKLIIAGNRGRDVTLYCMGEPTILGKRGNNVTIYSYDESGKCSMSHYGIDGNANCSVSLSLPPSQLAELLKSTNVSPSPVEVKSNEPPSSVKPVSVAMPKKPVSPAKPISPVSQPNSSPSSSGLFSFSATLVGGRIEAAPSAKVNIQGQDMSIFQKFKKRFGR